MSTLFERIGGHETVDKAVDIFYKKMLADDKVAPFFDRTYMPVQHPMQKTFLTMAFGGPSNYPGRSLSVTHKPLVENGLNDEHVDITIGYISETLKELGVSDEDIAEVVTLMNSFRNYILDR